MVESEHNIYRYSKDSTLTDTIVRLQRSIVYWWSEKLLFKVIVLTLTERIVVQHVHTPTELVLLLLLLRLRVGLLLRIGWLRFGLVVVLRLLGSKM